jgi:lipoprotein-releasing system permease protein
VMIFDWRHSDSSIFHAVEIEKNVMFIILTLIILIAAFNIISSLMMLVKDKTKDIAILRTFGASQSGILKIFLLTGAAIGISGAMCGLGLGISFALNIEKIRQFLQKLLGVELFNAEIYFLSKLTAKFIWSEVITVSCMAIILSLLATFYPAWRASRLDPIDAIRL